MRLIGSFWSFLVFGLPGFAATFGTVVPIVGGAADIVLDEPRQRLYLVNSSLNQIQIYQTSTNPPRLQTSLKVCNQPTSAVMSQDNNLLYVTCYADTSVAILNINATTPTTARPPLTLPANPEGIAMGFDGKIVITTIGTGRGTQTLLSYDPLSATSDKNPYDVFITPPAAASPTLPPPNGRIFEAYKSHLQPTLDGQYIVGVNNSGNNRIVFVYEVVSRTVLRSRTVTNLSGVLSISPDGSKFMAGSTLFDFQTLQVLAQQNAANSPYAVPGGNSGNFNLQQNQGGSVYSPDGSVLYSAFNIAPVQNPPARANVTQLLFNDPDNLLVNLGLQLPENLAGKMVITKDGSRIYALSDSGFVVLPISTASQSPIATPDQSVVLLGNDQCGVAASMQMGTVNIRNTGGGNRMTVTAQLQPTISGPGGLGGFGGPGGGGPGGGIIIILPGIVFGGGGPGGGGGFGNPLAANGTATATTQTAPLIRSAPNKDGSTTIDYLFNQLAARSPGTVPPHDFLIQSPEAINIPPRVRVFQNNHNAEDRGKVMSVPVGTSNSEGLIEMLTDTARQRIYVTNSGLNRLEVFDMKTQTFMAPIKLGQLPHSMAFGNDGSTLYVGSTGGESIDIVNLDTGQKTGRVKFPPLPFNAGFSLVTPSVLASSLRGPQVLMSDGTLWNIVGDTAVPRVLNPAVFGTNARVVPASNPVTRTMASTPDGQYVILSTSSGFVYLYSAAEDDFVVSRQVFSPPLSGFLGPVAAGPGGRYYLVNGTILNESLTPIGGAPSFTLGGTTTTLPTTPTGPGTTRPGTPTTPTGTPTVPNQPPLPGQVPGGPGLPTRGTTTVSRPIWAVAAMGANTFARFSQPVLLGNNAQVTDAGSIEIVDVTTGNTLYTTTTLEGQLSTVQNNGRASINGRTMAIDPSGAQAYMLTTSGLTMAPLTPVNPATAPVLQNNGVVNTANFLSNLAPGGLVSIFGKNLASSDASSANPLPAVLGGVCVTLNNQPLPLMMTSATQINAQIPPTLTAGRYPIVVRAIDRLIPSQTSLVSVAKYAPSVFVLDSSGQPALYHADGTLVTKDHKAQRDEPLTMYATGLGVTTGGKVFAGVPAPGNPLAVTQPVQVFFGNPGYSQAGIIVDWSGLVPGMIGTYQLSLRIPGNHLKGDALPIQLRIGGVFSPTTGTNVPYVAVE